MCQSVHQICRQSVADTARVVVQQHRCLRNGIGNGLEVEVKLLCGGLQEHGLQNGNAGCTVGHCHLGKTHALLCIDGTDTEVNRYPSGSLVHHDPETSLHLILLQLIELAVGAEGQNALHAAVDDEIHLLPHADFVNFLVLVNYGNDRDHYALDKICIHHFWSFTMETPVILS